MFMELAVTAIGIGIVVMIGYLVLAQVKAALPTENAKIQVVNDCVGTLTALGDCTPTGCSEAYSYATTPAVNSSHLWTCGNAGLEDGTSSLLTTAFAGLGLLAVGIIVLAAFGLIQIFQ